MDCSMGKALSRRHCSHVHQLPVCEPVVVRVLQYIRLLQLHRRGRTSPLPMHVTHVTAISDPLGVWSDATEPAGATCAVACIWGPQQT